ncbi:uncharacterized protein LOC119676353 [Teleopsis dalmanni]|uniref:uncharacterized protein LOC119676353 n=1 Tax=Teleopsis dalmanni TaxID=139649 RepID=UPI0018CF28DC|nr:uncharacterized protein LOC119676353 [Teleopsis dalmanni]
MDRKLNWGPNVIARTQKAMVAFYCCRGAIGKRWGLSPKSILWIYNVVVKPILLYGVLFWRNTLNRSTLCKKLKKVQRTALMTLSGALKSTPSLALNVIFNILPIDIAAKGEVAGAALRIRELGIGSSCGWMQDSILREIDFIPDITDYCTTITIVNRNLELFIPSRETWKNYSVKSDNRLNFFTDGSKLDGQVGGGVYCPELDLSMSFRLPDHCSVFQAEVSAILEVSDWLKHNVSSVKFINIFTDSQAAIKSLNSSTFNSRLVLNCLTSLMVMAEYFRIRIIWVPGHRDIQGNCIADELARHGTTAQILLEKKSVVFIMRSERDHLTQQVISQYRPIQPATTLQNNGLHTNGTLTVESICSQA